ncbi:hypothetical protein BC826DRAFT_1019525 [Russula brevipes]|nr:hypothetical protein BC826DRAFT_1019525 [Russula brevipes]
MKNHWKPGNLDIRKLMSHFSETLCTSCKVPIKPIFFSFKKGFYSEFPGFQVSSFQKLGNE